jgi:hypothetical protein
LTVQEARVETRIGELEFELGLPTEKTVATLFDELDFQRAVQTYARRRHADPCSPATLAPVRAPETHTPPNQHPSL